MAPKVKEAMSWASEAIETACGWAVAALALYAILFVDLNGNGRLIDTVQAAAREALGMAPAPRPVAVQTRVVPVRPVDEAKLAQDRMLTIPDVPEHEIAVPVVAANQPSPAETITDAPADPGAGKSWRKHLTGSLRSFTVYGRGEQASVTSAAAPAAGGSASGKAAASAAPTPAVAMSAYHQASVSAPAQARPGVSDHVVRVGETSDGVRNFR